MANSAQWVIINRREDPTRHSAHPRRTPVSVDYTVHFYVLSHRPRAHVLSAFAYTMFT